MKYSYKTSLQFEEIRAMGALNEICTPSAILFPGHVMKTFSWSKRESHPYTLLLSLFFFFFPPDFLGTQWNLFKQMGSRSCSLSHWLNCFWQHLYIPVLSVNFFFLKDDTKYGYQSSFSLSSNSKKYIVVVFIYFHFFWPGLLMKADVKLVWSVKYCVKALHKSIRSFSLGTYWANNLNSLHYSCMWEDYCMDRYCQNDITAFRALFGYESPR